MSCFYNVITLFVFALINLHFAEAEINETKTIDRLVELENDDVPREFFFIFTGLAVSGILRGFTKMLNIPIPFRVLILLFGILMGVLSEMYQYVDQYTSIKHIRPAYISTTFFPIIFFKTAFSIDSHTFVRSWSQIFCMGVLGTLINACLVGGIMMLLIDDHWQFTMGLFFGIVCSTIYPSEIVTMLKEIGKAKHLGILLEGEMMIGDGTAIIVFEILSGIIENQVSTWYQILMLFIRFAIGGIVLGYIIGKITTFTMAAYTESVNMLILTMVSAYLTFYIGEVLLSVSGVIAVVIVGIMASAERSSLSANSELFLIYFWEMLAYIANTIVFLIAGVTVPYRLKNYLTLENFALVLVMYVVVNVARFCSYIILAPIVSRIGYGLTFRNMIIAVWSCLRGPIPFCLTFSVLSRSDLEPLGKDLLLYVTALAILTLVINAATMPAFLRLLGLSELSMARKINMNNCMRFLQNRRDRAITIMKMNRFLGDANWPLVLKSTVLKHPYKINLTDTDDEEENYLGYRLTTCPDCQREIPNQPTNKEMLEMKREARLRILKAKRISYSRQYENGMLSKESIRVLTQAVEIAMDTEEAIIELDGLHKLFRRQGYPHYIRKKLLLIFFKKNENTIKPPRKYWRRICYHIMIHPVFDIFINCAVLLNCVPIGLEIGLTPRTGSDLGTGLIITNTFFFLIYFFEFVIKIYGYSWIYICKDGFKTYFSYYWNTFDFTILLFALADLILDYYALFSDEFEKANSKASKVTLITKLCRTIRLIRLLRLCKAWYPGLIKYCDSKIDKHLAFAYDVGKGFVTGEEEVADKLIQMIDNKTIRDECRLKMEADRLAITKELGMVQKDRPWIAITVKTKQAIRATLNSMVDAALELKVSGWVDDVEYIMIMESLEQKLKFVRTKVKSVQPIPPKVLFKEVSWMADDEHLSDFLYENVVTKIFDEGDVVCTDGQLSDGVYIIVTGMFKLVYEPQTEVLENLKIYGMLPIKDYITSTRFDEKVEDYIVSGNSIGELSVLTGRPYNCTITADTSSQAYILTHAVIKEAIKRSNDPINGIESRMWKSISIRLATTILMDTAAYQSTTQEKIHFELERAFIPNLSNFKIFGVNDMMEDIVLLEGFAVDYHTRDCYYAPCYIPRTVQKIILPKSSSNNLNFELESKLLIIPTKDVDEFDIMEREEEISVMVSTASSKCLQHAIQSKASAVKHRRKRQTTFGAPNRRVKYLDSISGTNSIPSTRSRMTQASAFSDETELQNIDMNVQIGTVPLSYIVNERDGHSIDKKISRIHGMPSDKRKTSIRKGSTISGRDKRKSEDRDHRKYSMDPNDKLNSKNSKENIIDENKENIDNNLSKADQASLHSVMDHSVQQTESHMFNTEPEENEVPKVQERRRSSDKNFIDQSKGNTNLTQSEDDGEEITDIKKYIIQEKRRSSDKNSMDNKKRTKSEDDGEEITDIKENIIQEKRRSSDKNSMDNKKRTKSEDDGKEITDIKENTLQERRRSSGKNSIDQSKDNKTQTKSEDDGKEITDLKEKKLSKTEEEITKEFERTKRNTAENTDENVPATSNRKYSQNDRKSVDSRETREKEAKKAGKDEQVEKVVNEGKPSSGASTADSDGTRSENRQQKRQSVSKRELDEEEENEKEITTSITYQHSWSTIPEEEDTSNNKKP